MSQDKTVLVVDDQEAILHLVQTILYMEGYTVLCGCSGEDALHVNGNHASPIHLLLTDIRMNPDFNGCDLAGSMRQARPDIRVIYMTAYPDDERIAREVETGAAGFIHKPFSPRELLREVKTALSETMLPHPMQRYQRR